VKMKYRGDFKTLQLTLLRTGIEGEWRLGENHNQYRANTGAVLNWWESTGTITFQGPGAAADDLKAAFLEKAVIVEVRSVK